MWLPSFNISLRKTCFLVFLFTIFCLSAKDNSKYVILITIDGMRSEMVTDDTMPSPNLKKMKNEGLFVKYLNVIAPSSTYPSHTTIITGVKPNLHGIYYNAPFTNNKAINISYWYADSIKTETIWDIAQHNGLKVASLFWPVSVGAKSINYNIPEFWSTQPVKNQLDFLKPYCSPGGILEELEREATGKLNYDNFMAGSMNRDAKTAYMANYLLNHYRPNLMTIHLITTDYSQHATGLNSDRVRATVGSVDNAVGLILENLKRNDLMDSTTVIVCGDHGFVKTYKNFAPNVWLVQEDLLSKEVGGEWKACFHRAGSTAFLYLKDEKDILTLKKVRKRLSSLPTETKKLFRIVEKEELLALGCDPRVSLALEAKEGIGVNSNRTGEDVIEKIGGQHGYLSGIDPTTLVAYGYGIKNEEIEEKSLTDIAPFILRLLGLQ